MSGRTVRTGKSLASGPETDGTLFAAGRQVSRMDVSAWIKRSFVTGLALVAPLFITIVAFQLLFSWLRGVIDPIVAGTRLARYTGNVPFLAEFVAVALLVLAVAVLGYLAQRSLGAYVFELVDRGLALVPVFSVVYTGVRQVSDALMTQQSRFAASSWWSIPARDCTPWGS